MYIATPKIPLLNTHVDWFVVPKEHAYLPSKEFIAPYWFVQNYVKQYPPPLSTPPPIHYK